jgi:hypothetical protein
MVELRSGVVEKARGTWSNLVVEARISGKLWTFLRSATFSHGELLDNFVHGGRDVEEADFLAPNAQRIHDVGGRVARAREGMAA